MEEISIYDYYCFGYNYNILKRGFSGKRNSHVKRDLQDYLERINELELHVTAQIVDKLKSICDSIDENDQIIDNDIAAKIKRIIDGADPALDAELQLRKVLVVTPKRFNQDMLLKHPVKLLAKNTSKSMSEIAKLDFSSATRCIAMNLPTAAAFHLMRCVEEMLKQLYFSFVKKNRMKNPMWGAII